MQNFAKKSNMVKISIFHNAAFTNNFEQNIICEFQAKIYIQT